LIGVAVLLAAGLQPALASTRATRTAAAISTPAPRPSGPLLAVVSIGSQSISVFSGTDRVAQAPVSSGMAGHRTPTGVFSILQKARYHESNLYSNAPMPFMQRLTWSGVALHAGALPGYPASHGCVRLPSGFASQLFGLSKIGTRVIVAPEAVAPFAIEHAALPRPILVPSTEPGAAGATSGGPASGHAGATAALALVPVAVAAPAVEEAGALLTPYRAAEVAKRTAALAHVQAAREAKAQLEAAERAAARADQLKLELDEAMAEVAGQRAQLMAAQRMSAAAVSDEDRVQAHASVSVVEEDLAELMRYVAAVKAAETRAGDAALEAAQAARRAEDAAMRAEAAMTAAQRGTEPITIYVSRKDNRAYVRQGFIPLFEGEANIREAARPIGTHVFTASDGGSATSLRWTGITVPERGQARSSASEALERVELGPEIAAEVGRRLFVGATLIISDHGISNETGKGTDFVVLTR
jgi:hypothetical protein